MNFIINEYCDEYREIVINCLKYTRVIKIKTKKYLRFAFERDDFELAIGLLKCNSDYDIHMLNKISPQMHRAIKNYI